MTRLAIFDLTWTLVGYRPEALHDCTLTILRGYDRTIGSSDVADYLTASPNERRAQRRRWGIHDDDGYAARWGDDDIVRRKLDGAICQPDVATLLWLADCGVALTLVSSSPPRVAKGEMAVVERALGSWPFRSCVIASRDSGLPMKPAPDIALRLMSAFEATPGETLVVGDDPDDIRFGLRAGAVTAWIDRGMPLRDVEPEHRLRTLDELRGIVRGPR